MKASDSVQHEVDPDLALQLSMILDAALEGRLVPFLGAGVNLCDRPEGTEFNAQQGAFLPNGRELARYLIQPYEHRVGVHEDLIRVSQFVLNEEGDGDFFNRLHRLFAQDYGPTSVHRFIASLPRRLREKGRLARYPLVMTTNYDDMMEQAFRDAGEEYDVLFYRVDGNHKGRFFHVRPDGTRTPILRPNDYTEVSVETRPVILKLHGAIERSEAIREDERGSFVIAEDHYVEYLTARDIRKLLPIELQDWLPQGKFLFLGYGMGDWNVRVMMYQLAAERRRRYRSWAVQLNPDLLDVEIWSSRHVDILNIDLRVLVGRLEEQLARVLGAER